MYNKLFSKIVDSSIWMEPDHVRLIWMMFIAIMDEDGFVNLASVKNVAHRAVMSLEKATEAIHVLESPDPESSNPANEGRRLTRVPGGWIVNNSKEYREIVKREHQKELNRERVRKHRGKTPSEHECNAGVMVANETVTPSEAEAEAEAEAEKPKHKVAAAPKSVFQKPTVQEVINYVLEIDAPVDAKEFIDYYTSNGWKIGGRASMKDWKATVRQWAARRRKEAAETANVSRYSEDFVETLKICKQYPGRESYEIREQKLGPRRTYAIKKSGGSTALIDASSNDQNLRNFAAVFELHLKESANGITASN